MSLPTLRDPERTLALAYVPRARRPALHALWALDDALGVIVAQARDPTLARIRLAWWREALRALGGNGPPPVDPLLRALDALVVPRAGPDRLARIAEGWDALLGAPDDDALDAHARDRGAALFELSAALLGVDAFGEAARAGRLWSLVDVTGRIDALDRALALAERELGEARSPRWPTPLRPLGMLVALAAHDARRGGGDPARGAPMRIARMIAHRLTGRTGLGVQRAPR